MAVAKLQSLTPEVAELPRAREKELVDQDTTTTYAWADGPTFQPTTSSSSFRVGCTLDLRGQPLPELTTLPQSLLRLCLSGCEYLVALPTLPANIASINLTGCRQLIAIVLDGLTRLEKLTLRRCETLTAFELPCDSIGRPLLARALRNVDLGQCSSLQALPRTFGALDCLERLTLDRCTMMGSHEGSLVLTSLRALDLSTNAEWAVELLPRLSGLAALEVINLSRCPTLVAPSDISQVTSLQEIDLSRCNGLESLPDDLGCLHNLAVLSLLGCSRLPSLPTSLSGLVSLMTLEITGCRALVALPESLGELGALRNLTCRSCSSLAALPTSVAGLVSLRALDLWGCRELRELPTDLGHAAELRRLNLGGCAALAALPDLARLWRLKVIVLDGCYDLKHRAPNGMLVLKAKARGMLPDVLRWDYSE